MTRVNKDRLLILYGSQTGNAQDVAEDIARIAERKHYCVESCSMNAYDISSLPVEKYALFITSTTGQGEAPDNMKTFWRFLLRKNLPRNSLDNLKCAVFGLGDSSYPKYNYVARKLSKRLTDLGATQIVSLGLGDDQDPRGGYYAALDLWLDEVWKYMQMHFPASNGVKMDDAGCLGSSRMRANLVSPPRRAYDSNNALIDERDFESFESCYAARVLQSRKGECSVEAFNKEYHEAGLFGSHRPYISNLRENERLTSIEHFQDVRRIVFELPPSMTFQAGDVLAVKPKQNLECLSRFFERTGFSPNTWIELSHAQSEASHVVHLGTLVASCLDVTGAPPRQYFFEVASHFAKDKLESERLLELASREGRDDLWKYCTRERRSILEVLEDFPSVSMPLEWIIQLSPRLQARQFSISSRCHVENQSAGGTVGNPVEITVALVKYTTPWKREKEGMCSSFLSELTEGCKPGIPVWIERSSLHFPGGDDPSSYILIGPGTGIAPFKALVESMVTRAETNDKKRILVFFGCRFKSSDFLHRDQWHSIIQSGCGPSLFASPGGFVTAFSRDHFGEKYTSTGIVQLGTEQYQERKASNRKYYVTQAIEDCAAEVWEIMSARMGRIYIAGAAGSMPKDVRKALQDVVSTRGGMSPSQADNFVKSLENTGRYQVEAWA